MLLTGKASLPLPPPRRTQRDKRCRSSAASASAGVLKPGCDAVDGQQQQALQALSLGLVRPAFPQRTEGAQLEVGERVDVGIAQLDGAAQHTPTLEQPSVARDREQPLQCQVILGQDKSRQVGPPAELQVAD